MHLLKSHSTKLMLVVIMFIISSSQLSHAIEAKKVSESIVIDGKADELAWQNENWHQLEHHIVGIKPEPVDFKGQFKLLWNENYLYLLAEITDDVLFDQHADPLHFYWDDDCLEVFIDEDNSGGEHQQNFNAFAYHIALDNQVVDIGKPNKDGSTNFILLNDHIDSKWQRSHESPHKIVWELAIKVYDDSFVLPDANKKGEINTPVMLSNNKKLGFMLAYCDNDGSKNREHFYGSKAIKPVNGDKNLGYKDASVFETLILKKD